MRSCASLQTRQGWSRILARMTRDGGPSFASTYPGGAVEEERNITPRACEPSVRQKDSERTLARLITWFIHVFASLADMYLLKKKYITSTWWWQGWWLRKGRVVPAGHACKRHANVYTTTNNTFSRKHWC